VAKRKFYSSFNGIFRKIEHGHFICSHEVAKRKFYSSFNGIFRKIEHVASEEVILNLITAKCIPCLLYVSEALPFSSSQLKSLGFPLKCILFKTFKTGSSDSQCQEYFNFPEVSELIFRGKRKFNKKFTITENLLCYTVKSKFQTVD